MKAWQALHVLSPEGCFPFAKKRNGTVLGEGAGIIVLESLEHAKKRGANILGELCGYGMSSDAKDMVNPDIEGPQEAMRRALADAEPRAFRHRVPQRARHRDDDQRRQRDARDQGGVRQPRQESRDLLDQVDARASARRRRRHRGRGLHPRHAARAGCRRPSASTRPIPSATSTTSPTSGRDLKVNYAMSNSFAFGGLNAVLVFGPPPA